MEWLKAKAVDDRGREFEPLKASVGLVREDPELGAVMARVNESIWRSGGPVRLAALIPILAGLLMAIVAPALIRYAGLPPWASGLVMLPVIVPIVLVTMRAARRRHAGRIVESVLRIGRCPGCGYRLENLAEEEDGAVVCPECAAAWKKARVLFATLPAEEVLRPSHSSSDMPPVGQAWLRGWTRMPTIVDDRDRSVPLVHLSLKTVDPSVNPVRVQAARALLLKHSLVDRIGCAGVLVAFAVFYGVSQLWSLSARGTGWFHLVGLLAVVLLVPVWVMGAWRIWSGRTWVGQKTALNILKETWICPSCAGNLALQKADADGCVVCPKCFAAWKLDR